MRIEFLIDKLIEKDREVSNFSKWWRESEEEVTKLKAELEAKDEVIEKLKQKLSDNDINLPFDFAEDEQ